MTANRNRSAARDAVRAASELNISKRTQTGISDWYEAHWSAGYALKYLTLAIAQQERNIYWITACRCRALGVSLVAVLLCSFVALLLCCCVAVGSADLSPALSVYHFIKCVPAA